MQGPPIDFGNSLSCCYYYPTQSPVVSITWHYFHNTCTPKSILIRIFVCLWFLTQWFLARVAVSRLKGRLEEFSWIVNRSEFVFLKSWSSRLFLLHHSWLHNAVKWKMVFCWKNTEQISLFLMYLSSQLTLDFCLMMFNSRTLHIVGQNCILKSYLLWCFLSPFFKTKVGGVGLLCNILQQFFAEYSFCNVMSRPKPIRNAWAMSECVIVWRTKQ